MRITGIIVYANPERSTTIHGALENIDGVEVHAVTADGRMVVTIEGCDDSPPDEVFEAILRTDGVLSTALVYHHDEALHQENC